MQTFAQFPLDIALPRFATFDTFVDKSGSDLVISLKSLEHTADEPRQYYIWGAKSTGKTHLLQAVCNHLNKANVKSVYFPLQEFSETISDIFRDLHSLDVVCLDDIDDLFGDSAWEIEIFKLINELRSQNKCLIMTSTISPTSSNIGLSDLASRLVWGPVYKLDILNGVQLEIALQQHAKIRGIELSEEVIGYMLTRYPRDIKKLTENLNTLDNESLVQKRKITIPFIKSVLD